MRQTLAPTLTLPRYRRGGNLALPCKAGEGGDPRGARGGWGQALALTLALLTTPLHAAELRATVPPGAQLETVYDHGTQACEAWDVPDAPARAWKGADGTVHLLAAHLRARTLNGPSLNAVRHDCRVVYESKKQDDPARYDDMGWLASPYSPDGTTIYALVHNEYHGHKRRDLCPAGDYMACWWNALTLSVSTDGGKSFGPARYVAGVPYRFRGDLGRRAGLFGPSNIVEHEGWYYAMSFAEKLGAQKRGVCLMRTRDLADPASWRGWDGRNFTVRFLDPYAEGKADPAAHACAPLPSDRLPFTVTGLVRHRATGQFVAVMAGQRAERPGAEPVSGVWTSTSANLVNWSKPRLAWAAPLLTHKDCADRETFYYPSILDPDAMSRNFEDTDGDAFLYLTRITQSRCKASRDRDLVRIMIRVSPADGG
ncbi:hypothetical protein [Azospirillum soli]|uniref:hypothetical protein n=1 Tax=Azospirillum soli TaxID=1304799 RepID=UPI001AE8F5F1|nr:hypothetical protein [Azospirillum soli]MBP2314236.1 hypothetical protein [Azospirillum soli]